LNAVSGLINKTKTNNNTKIGTLDTNDNTKREDALSAVSQLINTTESNNVETAVKETKTKSSKKKKCETRYKNR
jgi:hypothetical protein